MYKHHHALVWIDHHVAKVLKFNDVALPILAIQSSDPDRQVHLSESTHGTGKAPVDKRYYHAVAAALNDVEVILVCGPANAKQQLLAHLKSHDALIAERVLPLLTVDHPSDGQLAALAREHFKSDARMQSAA